MSGSINKVMLLGNLGKDPETRHFEGGGMLVKFSIATSETYTNRNGERVTQTEWHNIVAMRKGLAELCEKYLKKGHKVFVEGRIKTRSWTDDTGNTRYATEIHGDSITFLTSREEALQMEQNRTDGTKEGYTPPAPKQTESSSAQTNSNDFSLEDADDDLPF